MDKLLWIMQMTDEKPNAYILVSISCWAYFKIGILYKVLTQFYLSRKVSAYFDVAKVQVFYLVSSARKNAVVSYIGVY